MRASVVGAFCMLAFAAPVSTDWPKAETVTVIGTEYGFDPNQLTFRIGKAYRLHFENRGKELHEFTAPGFLKTVDRKSRESEP